MKKKLMSLLLVIAIMVSSVSMGLGAFAAPAGRGIEAINAFELTANTVNSASGTATVNIRSNNSNYKIKVNSITGYYKYMKENEDTSKTVSFSIGSDNVCGTSNKSFSSTVSIDANLSALIRYECNYDLLDSNGNVVYAGMTGYGYGYISADGDEQGKQSGTIGEPDKWDSYGFDGFDSASTLYVQVPTSSLYARCETSGNKHSASKSSSVTGNPPPTLTVHDFEWDNNCGGSTVKSVLWFELTAPPSGYYKFNITFYDGDSHDVQMYYREATHKTSADTKYNDYLDYGLEKSYYTTESWNAYMAALDKVALVAIATHNDNYSFQVACQTAADLSNTFTALENAKNGLEQVPADYAAAWDAWYIFDGKADEPNKYPGLKNKKVSVTTYEAGGSSHGTNDKDYLYYSQASIQAVTDYVNTIDMNLMKCDQKTVDGYEAKIRELTANLACADAVYTYLDNAIEEYSEIEKNSEIYTDDSWSSYKTAVDNAIAIPRDLKTNSQGTINSALVAIFDAKWALAKRPADTTELYVQLGNANIIYDEYDNNKIMTALPGFDEVWNYFESAYRTAFNTRNHKIDQQTEVDNATEELRNTIATLSIYRILDTTELQRVCALDLPTGHVPSNYVPDSYNLWNTLRNEGYSFIAKATPKNGAAEKTYADYDEMVRLISAIQNAYDNLEKVKADFTMLNEQIARIPSDDVLALYKKDYVDAIKAIVATIDYGATFDEQNKVDEITGDLKAAIDALNDYENYKSADYSEVEKAIEEARAIDPDVVNNEEILDAAINAVDWDKKIIEQAEVDAMAAAIREAIKNLDYIPADYTEVDKAIAEAGAYSENKDWYVNYYKVEEAIEAVDRTKNHQQQAEVDAMAEAIRKAIANLKLADADYSGIRDAIALYNAQAPLTDFEPDTVDAVDSAIGNVQYGLMADEQYKVDDWEDEIIKAIGNMKLLPADYSRLNAAKTYAERLNPAEYSNYGIVTEAIEAINWDLNCRQNAEMQAQIDAINNAVAQLKLLPADYTKVDEAIEAARYACQNGAYPYTQESIDVVEAVIESINWDYDIKHQTDVDAYIIKIQNAVAQLTYIRANYDELDEVKLKYDNLQRDLYSSLLAVDAYVAKIDWNKTIDQQSEVDTYAAELDAMIEKLEYAPADYTAVDNAITIYNSINKEYYEAYDIAMVEMVISQVVPDLKKNEQDRVNQMAQNINDAIAILRTKMKKADLDKLADAVAQANTRLDEMEATGYAIDRDTLLALDTLLRRANDYNAETTIDNQEDIDALADKIIEATAKLEFVFTKILDGSGLVIKDGYIYGFEEGTTSADAKELIKFVGAAEIKITEGDNGFGTDTKIQFISTKDGSVIETYTVLVFGDANGDAVIDMFDVAYIVELVNEGDKPEDMLLRVLDITMDGYLDVTDVTIMIGLANMDATLMQDGSMVRY